MNLRLIANALLFTALVPGVVIVGVPCVILGGFACEAPNELSILQTLALFTGLIGIAVLLHCIWSFALFGQGTLAPVKPPQVLVIRGLYRITRNPMYLGVTAVLISEYVFFGNAGLLLYALAAALCFHLFVVYYEEPHLRKRFGEEYLRYCGSVPRWTVTLRSFSGRNHT